jgi:hypothetical protein
MLKHRITALLSSVGLAAGLMSTVAVASASATTSHCKVSVTQIQAWELQDGDGQDEIRFELGDDTYGTYTFGQGWYRNSSLGSPRPYEVTSGSSVHFEIWDRDYPATQTIGSAALSCVDGPHDRDFTEHGGGYTVWYTTSHV